MRLMVLVCGVLIAVICPAQTPAPSVYRWTTFVQVDGQREPVPAEWVATPEGKFAHSIKVPNPLPKESGYRPGMTSEQYFEHLCKTEAGEFIYKTVENVEGFYFMRPPKRPTDDDLQSRYVLEAPDIERTYQLYPPDPGGRSTLFVIPNVHRYRYLEESQANTGQFVRAFGFEKGTVRPKPLETSPTLKSAYGVTWRGIKRSLDRENTIAGSEWIVIHVRSGEVLAFFRNYARTGGVANTAEGIWWLNAVQCPNLRPASSAGRLGRRWYEFLEKVLVPEKGAAQ